MRFHLVRYFTIASLGMIILVSAALIFFERDQSLYFQDVQGKQIEFVKTVQDRFADQQGETAKRDLMATYEAGNLNLVRVISNTVWERDIAPFVRKAQAISADHCRAIPDEADKDGMMAMPPAKKECFSDVGKKILALPGFKELDAKMAATMRGSAVFKMKAYDTLGTTVYSSDHSQVGDDKSTNSGWKNAMAGKPSSKLSHRDTFNAYEGVVTDRDLHESYIPILEQGTGKVIAVFELYSDVSLILKQMNATAALIRKTADTNQQQLLSESQAAQAAIDAASTRILIIVIVLMLALFGALLWIVRRADAIIKAQAAEREHTHQQLAQSAKMASLGQMVAGVAHQMNTPLAFSRSNVEMVQQALGTMDPAMQVSRVMTNVLRRAQGDQVVLNIGRAKSNLEKLEESQVDLSMLQQMLADTLDGIAQMTELVVNLRDFTRLDRSKVSNADVNKSLHTVVYIAKTVISKKVQIEESFGTLPQIECNTSQLNEVFLNLINNAAQSIDGVGKVTVRSFVENDQVVVQVSDTGSGIPPDVLEHIFDTYYTTKPEGEGTGLGLTIARDIVRQHGGDLTVSTEVGTGSTFTVRLPIKQAVLQDNASS